MEPFLTGTMRGPQKYVTNAAVEVLQVSCEDGTSAPPPVSFPDYGAFLDQEKIDDSRLFGISDMSSVHRWGYSRPEPQPSGIAYRFEGSIDHLPLANPPIPVETAAPGTPSGAAPAKDAAACIRWANAQIYGSPDGLGQTSGMRLFVEAWDRAKEDAAVRRSFDEWRRCMVARGHHDVPKDPLTYQPFPAREEGTTPPEEEVATAADDVDCKARAGVVKHWSAAIERRTRPLVHAHADEMKRDRRRIAQAVARAEKITGLTVDAPP